MKIEQIKLSASPFNKTLWNTMEDEAYVTEKLMKTLHSQTENRSYII